MPLDFIRDVFDVVRATPRHTYQVLTKRAHRLERIADQLEWPDNLWMGVSVEGVSSPAFPLSPAEAPESPPKRSSRAASRVSSKAILSPNETSTLRRIGYVV